MSTKTCFQVSSNARDLKLALYLISTNPHVFMLKSRAGLQEKKKRVSVDLQTTLFFIQIYLGTSFVPFFDIVKVLILPFRCC